MTLHGSSCETFFFLPCCKAISSSRPVIVRLFPPIIDLLVQLHVSRFVVTNGPENQHRSDVEN